MPMTTPPLRWLRDAVARKALAEHMSHYHLSGRQAAATDGNITAAHPMPMDVPTCLVKGEHIEAASRALDGVPTFTLEDRALLVRGGGTRIRMPILDGDMWTPTPLEGPWRPVPVGLVDMLTDLLPFVAEGSDNTSWVGCIAVAEGALWATDRNIMAKSRLPMDVDDVNVLLARSTVEFVVDRAEGLAEWCIVPGAIGFRWENGAWMRSTVVTGEWPVQTGRNLLSQERLSQAIHPITDAWRAAMDRLLSAAGTSAKIIELRNEAMSVESGGLFVEVDANNLLPDGAPATAWMPSSLRRIADKAASWNPSLSPAPFIGQRVEGVVARAAAEGR